MKRALCEATFCELKGGFIYKTGRGYGSTAAIASGRAVQDAIRQVARKHIHVMKCTITVVEAQRDQQGKTLRKVAA